MPTPVMNFLLYRLNYEHRPTLFESAIRNDDDLLLVLKRATEPRFDVVKSRVTSGFQWSLRSFHLTETEDEPELRDVVVLTLAKSTLYRAGMVVTDSGMASAVSTSTPALADKLLILLDLNRHIFAIEYNSYLLQSDAWRKELEQTLAKAARAEGFGTRILLIPVPPREEVNARLQRFEKITRVKLTLSLPNPDIGPTFKRLYEEMIEGGVRELKQDMSNRDGLIVSEQSLPKASLDMALSGYKRGTVTVTGLENGRPSKIVVGDDVSRVEVYGIRQYAEGIAAGSNDPAVRRAARAIVSKIDESLRTE
jgi:hypothetical protein